MEKQIFLSRKHWNGVILYTASGATIGFVAGDGESIFSNQMFFIWFFIFLFVAGCAFIFKVFIQREAGNAVATFLQSRLFGGISTFAFFAFANYIASNLGFWLSIISTGIFGCLIGIITMRSDYLSKRQGVEPSE